MGKEWEENLRDSANTGDLHFKKMLYKSSPGYHFWQL